MNYQIPPIKKIIMDYLANANLQCSNVLISMHLGLEKVSHNTFSKMGVLFFFSTFCFLHSSYSQIKDTPCMSVDALIQLLEKELDGEILVDTLNERAYLNSRNIKLSRCYAQAAIEEAKQLSYTKGLGDAYIRLGIIAKNEADYEVAEEFYKKALDHRKNLNEDGPLINTYQNFGILYRNQGKFQQAIDFFFEGLALITEDNEEKFKKKKVKLLNGLATCHYHMGEYPTALEFNLDDIKLRKELKDSNGLFVSYLTNGNIQLKLKNFEEAESSYKTSLELAKQKQDKYGILDAEFNFGNLHLEKGLHKKALNEYRNIVASQDDLTSDQTEILFRNLGVVHHNLFQLDSALYYFSLCKSLLNDSKNFWNLSDLNLQIGTLFKDMGQMEEAIDELEDGLNIYTKNRLKDPILRMNLLNNLSQAYSQTKDYEPAFSYKKQYSLTLDSLLSISLEAANYQVNYEKQKRFYQELINQKEIESLKAMQLIITLIGIIILSILGAGIALLIYRQRKKKREMALEIDNLLREHEIENSYARLEGQDTERQRISQELHDRLGSMLATVKLYFSAIDSKMDLLRLETKEQYTKANELLDDACVEVRNIAHDIHSGLLKNFGLKMQLEELKETINTSRQIEVELVTHKFDMRLPTKLEVNIYRIIQELISNTLKHANANKLTIQLSYFNNFINILIEDDGDGFKKNLVKEKKGLGLVGIKKRIEVLKGTMKIDTDLGRGTHISIDIPYEPSEALSQS